MGAHLIDGEFQSDKYPTCPRGKVPLSVKDPTAQDLLWEYAQRRRVVDAEFAEDLEVALRVAGFVPPEQGSLWRTLISTICAGAFCDNGAQIPHRSVERALEEDRKAGFIDPTLDEVTLLISGGPDGEPPASLRESHPALDALLAREMT
jgi:hypothetical protein